MPVFSTRAQAHFGTDGEHSTQSVDGACERCKCRVITRIRQHLLGQFDTALVDRAHTGHGHLEHRRFQRCQQRGEPNDERKEEHGRPICPGEHVGRVLCWVVSYEVGMRGDVHAHICRADAPRASKQQVSRRR